jgi:hypothetical protein
MHKRFKKIPIATRKSFYYIHRAFQQIFSLFFREDAGGNNRITANGDERITADSQH